MLPDPSPRLRGWARACGPSGASARAGQRAASRAADWAPGVPTVRAAADPFPSPAEPAPAGAKGSCPPCERDRPWAHGCARATAGAGVRGAARRSGAPASPA